MLDVKEDGIAPRCVAAWSLVGACLAFGVTSLGIFTVPLGALLALALRGRRGRANRLGLIAGAGIVFTTLGAVNLNYRACTSTSGQAHLAPGAARSTTFACGGVDGLPWLVVGIVVVAVALLLFLRATRRAT